MRVYSVQNDVNRYQFVVAMRDEDATLLAALDGTPRAQSWRPPAVRIYQPQLKAGDFYQFLSAAFIMSERAVQVLRPQLVAAGELLPVACDHRALTLLNVTNLVDCLPPQWVDEAVIHDTLVLDADQLRRSAAALFKIPRLATSRVFVVEGLRPPEEEFRALVEREQLRGLEWQEVWNDEGRPTIAG